MLSVRGGGGGPAPPPVWRQATRHLKFSDCPIKIDHQSRDTSSTQNHHHKIANEEKRLPAAATHHPERGRERSHSYFIIFLIDLRTTFERYETMKLSLCIPLLLSAKSLAFAPLSSPKASSPSVTSTTSSSQLQSTLAPGNSPQLQSEGDNDDNDNAPLRGALSMTIDWSFPCY